MSEVLEFKSALRRGLGRAMLLLRKTPDAPELRNELLKACKQNLVYDPQCEVSRAPYLYGLIRKIQQERTYWAMLVSELSIRDTSEKQYFLESTQAFHLICLIAAANPKLDRAVIKSIITKSVFDDFTRDCMSDFVQLEGIDGFLFCFENYGGVIGRKEWNEDWSFRGLTNALIERDGLDVATAAISKARADDPELDRVLHLLDADDVTDEQAEAFIDRNSVIAHVAQGKLIPWRWIRAANQDDLDWAAGKLLEAHDDKEILAYLRVFGRRPFPEPIDRLFPWMRSANTRVAYATSRALGQFKNVKLRALALELSSDGINPASVVNLFQSSFQPGDFDMIEKLLVETKNDEDAYHSLCLAILNLLSNSPTALGESRSALLHLYEHGPCSNCREHVVSALMAINPAPDWMAEECQYDCVPEIAALVRSP